MSPSTTTFQLAAIPSSYEACEAVWKMQRPLKWCVTRFTAHYGSGIEAFPRNILIVIQYAAALFLILPSTVVAGVGALVNLWVGAPRINWDNIGEAPPPTKTLDAAILSEPVADDQVCEKLSEWLSHNVQTDPNLYIVPTILQSEDDFVLLNVKTYTISEK
ncbi:MAG: hypothetical protein JJU12_01135 [Chlamydiales bacterium]|nr:hypothetical protein [Chlamydiales bacterium]